ncbi:MAG TPA: carbon monoxide dehydrogenase subunit G [Burkholderiales bacterium]
MEMSSSRTIPASQEQTWQALNDPEVLKAAIPGCESIEKLSETEYQIVMAAKVGPVSARFRGRMLLSDIDAPSAYTLTFEGQGGAAGFAKGGASVRLVPEDHGTTRLEYTVNAQVGGKLAQIGSRLIDGAAKKMADEFFAAFAAQLAGGPEGSAAGTDATVPGDGADGGAKKRGWWRRRRE